MFHFALILLEKLWIHLFSPSYRVLLTGFASKAWSTDKESTILDLPDIVLANQAKFQPRLHLSLNIFFGHFRCIMVQFQLVKHKFPNETTFLVPLYGF